jgi:hypothetical protein
MPVSLDKIQVYRFLALLDGLVIAIVDNGVAAHLRTVLTSK